MQYSEYLLLLHVRRGILPHDIDVISENTFSVNIHCSFFFYSRPIVGIRANYKL